MDFHSPILIFFCRFLYYLPRHFSADMMPFAIIYELMMMLSYFDALYFSRFYFAPFAIASICYFVDC